MLMFDMCRFDAAWDPHHVSVWCAAFDDSDLEVNQPRAVAVEVLPVAVVVEMVVEAVFVVEVVAVVGVVEVMPVDVSAV